MNTATKQQTTASREKVIAHLQKAYSMELEAVANYLADSVNLDGVRAEEIKKSLSDEVQDELGHASKLAARIKQLDGHVPGPGQLSFEHSHLRNTDQHTDVVDVIRSVIQDEQDAIDHYRTIIQETDGEDFVTQDLCIELLADEEKHITLFNGFLKEYENA